MKQGFNLLKPQIEPPNIWTNIYAWIVNTARIILILTETAVILALVIRIVVDVQSKDLDEKIKNYDSILALRAPEEQKYLDLQNKTKTYQEANDSLPKYSNIVKAITDNLPREFINVSVNFQKNEITINGEAQNKYIQRMEEFLKNSDLFTNSNLTTLNIEESTETDKLAKFIFSTKINNEELRKLITEDQ